MSATALLAHTQAAQALVDGCVDLDADEDRLALLDAVCAGLGDALYPAFLQLLWIVGRCGDHRARELVARTLVHALQTGRLPSGRRAAWGVDVAPLGIAPLGAACRLGPLEYLCAWHAQGGQAERPDERQFVESAAALMDLVSASREARLLYAGKLLADADDPIANGLARDTRQALRAMASAWLDGAATDAAATRFVDALVRANPREPSDRRLAEAQSIRTPAFFTSRA